VRIAGEDGLDGVYADLGAWSDDAQFFNTFTPEIPDGINSIISRTKEWISACVQDHSDCRIITPNGVGEACDAIILPTRLIDVGISGENTTPKLALLAEIRDDKPLPEYATLSYAWGPRTSTLKTTASNVDNLRKQIDVQKLPKTIQDAIDFTRRLNIRYLWVDSLCILQARDGMSLDYDHRDDWQKEAGRFGQYYQNSVLTIAATGASGATEGLFLERLCQNVAERINPYTLHHDTGRDGPTVTTIYPAVPLWGVEVDDAPLSKRGWAMQERLLSRRVLHFSPNTVFWECQQKRQSELLLDPSDNPRDYESQNRDVPGSDFMLNFWDLSNISADLVVRIWFDFIEHYSAMAFTKISDRLPALSSAARVVQRHLQQPYLAGIWEESIAYGLAWRTFPMDHNGTFTSDNNYRAPSWSWAAAVGEAIFPQSISKWDPKLQFQGRKLEYRGGDSHEQIQRRRLTVRGKFMEENMETLLGLHANADYYCQSFFEKKWMDPENPARALRPPTKMYLDLPACAACMPERMSCILLGVHHLKPSDWPDYSNGRPRFGDALVLEPTGSSRNGIDEFERIGYLRLPYDDFWAQVTNERTIDLV
jgi:hypothetical protein